MKYSLAQLQQLAANAGFPDPALAAAVGWAESGGDSCAQGDPNTGSSPCSGPNGTSTSFGIWQIHQTAHTEYDPTALLDGAYNAHAAYVISQGGSNWAPWTTYKTGAYTQWYVPFAPAPLPNAPQPQPQPAPIIIPQVQRAPVLVVAVGALALAAAAGYATLETRRRYA